MTIPLPRASAGTPVDRDLALLHADLVAARSVVRSERCGVRRTLGERHAAAADLLECLELYTRALAARRLPIPPRIRDELRLRRRLSPTLPE